MHASYLFSIYSDFYREREKGTISNFEMIQIKMSEFVAILISNHAKSAKSKILNDSFIQTALNHGKTGRIQLFSYRTFFCELF